MRTCRLLSVSRDMVGNNVTVRAEIYQQMTSFKKVLDTIEVEIPNGVTMTDEELNAQVLAIYELSLIE